MSEVILIGEEADVCESTGGGCSASSQTKLGISYGACHNELYVRYCREKPRKDALLDVLNLRLLREYRTTASNAAPLSRESRQRLAQSLN